MKINLNRFLLITVLITISLISSVFAQVTSTTSSGRNQSATDEVRKAEAKYEQIANDAGIYFKQGLLHLEDNNRQKARGEFDKSVEVFLKSELDVRSNRKLQACYDQLIETIYRIEFPSNQQPRVKDLASTCGWNIDGKLADTVVKQTQNPQTATAQNSTDKSLITSVVDRNTQTEAPVAGFSEQRFEKSPLDDLAKLELTEVELNVDTPQAQQQYAYIQYAVANKSLGFSFQVHPMIQQFVNYYQSRGRSTMETGLYRSGMFMLMARRIFREEGIPENVAWLGQVESAWKPTAASWAAAKGLWQFIPGTGARYGLRINGHLDERSSFEKATRASAQYLKFLANRYNGNWELAMAAYNSGEGNVDRAVRRAGVANFWVAYPYLPRETRNYVPNILATILIANNPAKYGFGHVRPAPKLQYDTVRVSGSTSLSLIAQAADTTPEYLRYLNPEFRTNMTPPEPYAVRVPAGKGTEVFAVLKRVPGSRDVRVANVAAGENWQNVANRTGVSVEELRAANGGAAPGKKVVVPNGNGVKSTSYVRPTTPTPSPVTSRGVITVKAKAGDTVASIAARYGIAPIIVARHNGLSSIDAPLAAGREIKIPPQ